MSIGTGLSSPVTSLEALRQSFGRTAAVWAHHRFEIADHGWVAQSGAQQPDYNLALVHQGDVKTHVDAVVESVHGAGVPTLLMLAGEGLSGAQTLADRGWVSLRAMPFIVADTGAATADPSVREITDDDLPAARVLASAAFGVGPEVAALVYSPEMLAREDTLVMGVRDDAGDLVSCGMLCIADGACSGWTVATMPGRTRAGYASRLIAGGMALDAARRGPTHILGLSTPVALSLYRSFGFEVAEYWQVWSRPRWVLGAA